MLLVESPDANRGEKSLKKGNFLQPPHPMIGKPKYISLCFWFTTFFLCEAVQPTVASMDVCQTQVVCAKGMAHKSGLILIDHLVLQKMELLPAARILAYIFSVHLCRIF